MLNMKKRQLLLLSLLCVMGVMGQQRLKYHEDSKRWAEAQAHCREYHTDLVTIRNDAENNQVIEDSWLGLYRDNSSSNWKWSRGDEPLTYNNTWHSNDDPDNNENCIYKQDNDGSWRGKNCGEDHKFYCVVETLVLVREMKTWEEALLHCRTMVSGTQGYELATVISQEDQDFARNRIQDKVWTGLRFLGDQWMWVGGEEVQYSNETECPSERCGMLEKASTRPFDTGKCEERRNFFCYRRPPPVT